ncbi:DeoR/GlpR family DNA-binding transcription regulator [Litorihabitans aurantiacus]|uniref:Transcriptional regulator n=1 Tax=Litorihabitans aurantiacus TaxID=1930061 RepID=A0AA37XGL7_9MICO|nr:DeoR/GlpR family DNA-binding transcription regulator [Litorihabitans aurantiacus]GMA32956.1 transcriptional regulator [Litorihabitans aurantiacus]
MEREDRLSRLVDYIVEHGSVHVDDVVATFDISPATARRDLDALAEQQLVSRTRGGAVSNSTSGDTPLRYRTVRHGGAKRAIASAVAAMVTPGEVIAFNGGTTTTAAAFEVGIRTAADPAFHDVTTTVVTNAVNIANDLVVRPALRIVVTGGVARPRSYELVGPLASLKLPDITIDTLFLGAHALDVERGYFTHHDGEAAINAELVRLARRTVAVVDSSKLGATAFARICGVDDVDVLLTDAGADPGSLDRVREHGVDVVTVGGPGEG